MNCTRCRERLGNTRCEGCGTLFCLPCMNSHHDDLAQHFHTLMDRRNEVKQAIDRAADITQRPTENSYHNDIDRWEQTMLEGIQRLASVVRADANELFKSHMAEIDLQFEKLSTQMEQQQKGSIFLETNIEKMEQQLNQVQNQIRNLHKKIRVDSSVSNNIEWTRLIQIVQDDLPNKIAVETSGQAFGATEDLLPRNLEDFLQDTPKLKSTADDTTRSKSSAACWMPTDVKRSKDQIHRKSALQPFDTPSRMNSDAGEHVARAEVAHRSQETNELSSKDDRADRKVSPRQPATWKVVHCPICTRTNVVNTQVENMCLVYQTPLVD